MISDQQKLDAAISWLLPGSDPENGRIYTIEKATRPDGPPRYKVMDGRSCLSKNGEWEYEPLPSNRDDEFLARTRWDSFDEAWAAGIKAIAAINEQYERLRSARAAEKSQKGI